MRLARTHALAIAGALMLSSYALPVLAQDAESPGPGSSEAPVVEATMSPSGETAAGLEASVPSEIGSMVLTTSTFEAADVLANVESDALLLDLADLALAYDTELNRLAVAGGGGVEGEAFVSIIGARMPGVPAEELEEAFVGIVLGPTDPELTAPGTVAGQEVTVIRADADAGPASTAYLLPVGEVAGLVIADEANLEAAIEALAAE